MLVYRLLTAHEIALPVHVTNQCARGCLTKAWVLVYPSRAGIKNRAFREFLVVWLVPSDPLEGGGSASEAAFALQCLGGCGVLARALGPPLGGCLALAWRSGSSSCRAVQLLENPKLGGNHAFYAAPLQHAALPREKPGGEERGAWVLCCFCYGATRNSSIGWAQGDLGKSTEASEEKKEEEKNRDMFHT